jgi:hypothetical protein
MRPTSIIATNVARQQKPGRDDGIADHVLQERRGQRHGREQHQAHDSHEHAAADKILVLEQRELDERL